MNNNANSVKSVITINAPQKDVWQKIGFYEHVKKSPNLLLKLSLPIPREAVGAYSKPGDICRCKYSDGGYLTKRITQVVDNSRIEFDIIEQSIRHQNSVKLLGGSIEVAETDSRQCTVTMVTRYENHLFPKPLSMFAINVVIKCMHRFVMRDMRDQLQSTTATAALV